MPRPRITRLLLPVGLVLVAALAGLGWWAKRHGKAWLDRKVEARVQEIIDRACVPGYSFTMESLDADAMHGSLHVVHADLRFEPGLQDSLKTGAYRYLFAAEVDTIALRGLSFWRLLLRGEFNVDAVVVSRPRFHYYTGPGHVDLADPFNRLADTGDGGLVRLLYADTIRVHHAGAIVQNEAWRLPALHVDGLDLECTGASIHAARTRSGVRLAIGDAHIHVDSIGAWLSDGSRLQVGSISLERNGGKGLINNVRITPAPLDSTDRTALRTTRVAMTVDSITLRGLDLDRSISDEALRIQRTGLYNLRIAAELDKTRPEPPFRTVMLPAMALDSLPFAIRLDTLDLFHADIVYREREPRTGRWGEVPFQEVDGRFTGITNEEELKAQGTRLKGNLRFRIFGSGPATATFNAALDGSNRFTVDAEVPDLALTRIDPLTRALLRMEVRSGELHRLHLHMEGNDDCAKGSLAMSYTDLRFGVEPGAPAEVRHSLFGNVLDAMLSQTYGGGISADSERNFSVDRAKDRSVLTYAWHGVREGLLRNLVPEAKERMRTMLRTDLDRLKEQKALRKERKASGR
jgi:hypothetical protein